jgi:AcrR family transcriptional regulator
LPRAPAKPLRRQAKQTRSQATVDAVLEAAARILLRAGYVAATTNRIAEVAGVSIGTLYQYFADKDAVFDALIQRELETAGSVLDAAAIDGDQPLESSLRQLLDAFRRLQPRGPELYRQLEHVPNALLRSRLAERNERAVAFARRLLEAHRAEIRVDDLDLAAFMLVHATQGIALSASPELFGERLTTELARLFTRYLQGD